MQPGETEHGTQREQCIQAITSRGQPGIVCHPRHDLLSGISSVAQQFAAYRWIYFLLALGLSLVNSFCAF